MTGTNEEQFRMKDNRGTHRPNAQEESQMGHVSNAEKEVLGRPSQSGSGFVWENGMPKRLTEGTVCLYTDGDTQHLFYRKLSMFYKARSAFPGPSDG